MSPSESFWLGVCAATFLWGCASAATVMWLRALLRDAGGEEMSNEDSDI